MRFSRLCTWESQFFDHQKPISTMCSFAGAHHYELWTTWVAHQGGPLRVQILFFYSFPPVAASCVKMKHPWNQSPNQRFGWFWSCCGKIGKILWTDKHPKPEMLVIFGSVHSFFSIDRGRSWPIASLFFRVSSPLQPLVLLHSGGSQDPGLNAFGGAGLTGGFWRIFMGLYSLNGILVRLMGF